MSTSRPPRRMKPMSTDRGTSWRDAPFANNLPLSKHDPGRRLLVELCQ
jgi:hypothetical protein